MQELGATAVLRMMMPSIGWPTALNLLRQFPCRRPSMLLSLALAVSGYLVLLVATWLASDRRVQIANTTVTVLSLFIAVPLYAGAFHPAQDGEFMAAFVLVGLPTIVVALILLIFGLLARARGRLPSNPAFESGPPSAAAQRER